MFDNKIVISYIQKREFEKGKIYCETHMEHNKELIMLYFLINLAIQEEENQESSFFDISNDYNDWIKHYRTLKFYIRRLEQDRFDDYTTEFLDYIRRFNVSATALLYIIMYSTLSPDSILEKCKAIL